MIFDRIRRMFARKVMPGKGPLGDFWYAPAAYNGRDVTPNAAMGVSAYFACLANISEDMAKLPLPVFRKDGDEREQLPDHHLSHILNTSFNTNMTAFSGRQTLTQWALGWGNGYAEIERNGIDRPTALWPIHPSRVTVSIEPPMQLTYTVNNNDGGQVELSPRNVFHIVGRLSDDGITGVSIAQAGRQSISRGMSIQDYGTSLLNAGMSDRIAIKHPGKLHSQTPQHIRASWVELYGGTPGIERGPAILQEGMDIVRIGIPPKDAQLLDEAQFTPEDVARFFRMPLSKIGHFLRAQGWSTLETLNTDYVTDTLLPWDVKWGQEARRKLFGLAETDLYIGHNFRALMKGDSQARMNFYTGGFRLGLFSRNEIRAWEDMNPIEGGDVYYIESSNLAPLDDDGLPVVPEPVVAPVPEPEPETTTTNEDEDLSRPILFAAVLTPPQLTEDDNGEEAKQEEEDWGHPPDRGPADPDPENPDPPPAADGQAAGDTAADGDNLAAVRAAAEAALDHAFQRIARKESKALRKAIREHLDRGNREQFRTWTTGFYGDMVRELRVELGPPSAVLETITGSVGELHARCQIHAEQSRAALLAALDSGGARAVKATAGEWEKGW
jgi:HK97 family phage portal protein